MELTVDVTDDGSGTVAITVVGAVDLQSRTLLIEAAQDKLEAGGVSALSLDLSGVTFLDSTGIGAIVEIAGTVEDAEAQFAIRNPSARVLRVLEVTGLSDAWTLEYDPDTG